MSCHKVAAANTPEANSSITTTTIRPEVVTTTETAGRPHFVHRKYRKYYRNLRKKAGTARDEGGKEEEEGRQKIEDKVITIMHQLDFVLSLNLAFNLSFIYT